MKENSAEPVVHLEDEYRYKPTERRTAPPCYAKNLFNAGPLVCFFATQIGTIRRPLNLSNGSF